MKKILLSMLLGLGILNSTFLMAAHLVGEKVPDVSAKDQEGTEVKLRDLKGHWVLLYFYPKDDTPGCTKQACSIRDNYSKFKKAGIIVYGVSTQDDKSHKEFRAKYRLPFNLLVDKEGAIGKAFEIDRYPMVGIYKRQSVLIGPDGIVHKKFDDVDPDKHADMILDTVIAAGGLK